MRFLVLNYEYPPLGGGAGNATYFLCREWARMGIVTDIVTTWFPGLDQETCESALVTVHRVRSRRKKAAQSNAVEMLSYVAQGYLKARVLCERHAYDRVVSFFAIPCGMIALRLNQKLAIPYAVLLRGGDVPGFLPRELAFYHRLTMPLTRRIWRNADRVVANSRGLQELASVTGRRIGVTVDMVPNDCCPAILPVWCWWATVRMGRAFRNGYGPHRVCSRVSPCFPGPREMKSDSTTATRIALSTRPSAKGCRTRYLRPWRVGCR